MSDSSPIIALSSINQLGLLRRLFGTVCIPNAVKREVMWERREDVRDAIAKGWIVSSEIADRRIVQRLRAVLGEGEAEAISLAMESPNSLLLVDDQLVRRKATARGIHIVGTLGLLVVAGERGLTGDLETLCRQLVVKGFWLSEDVIREVVSRQKAH